MTIPGTDSCRTDQAQKRSMMIVMGMAAMVRPNSASTKLMMMTSDWTSYPRTAISSNHRNGTEEEVEFQQGDKDLIYEKALSHLD
jgi:hypothetical protein